MVILSEKMAQKPSKKLVNYPQLCATYKPLVNTSYP